MADAIIGATAGLFIGAFFDTMFTREVTEGTLMFVGIVLGFCYGMDKKKKDQELLDRVEAERFNKELLAYQQIKAWRAKEEAENREEVTK